MSNSVSILKKCLEDIKRMSKEEVQQRIKSLGLDDKNYDDSIYEDPNFEIMLPNESNDKAYEDLYVEWTGSYPCLCHGKWIIRYKGQELNVPKDKKYDHMNTGKTYLDAMTYEYDYFYPENYHDPEYYDGLEEDEWIQHNIEWIVPMFHEFNITVTAEILSNLYKQINKQDWRSGSCGGCI